MQLKTRPVVAEIGRLIHNVKVAALAETELKNAATFFCKLPQEQANNLANGLFGIYTPPTADPHVLDNVCLLWPELWPFISKDTRRELGVKLARFRANADKDRADWAKELLELVDGGAAYLPESDWLVEIQETLEDLKRAHQGTNNFYNEPPVARCLRDVVSRHGEVPELLTGPCVATLMDAFLTNNYGVAWNAEPYHIELIKRFDGPQACEPTAHIPAPSTYASTTGPPGENYAPRCAVPTSSAPHQRDHPAQHTCTSACRSAAMPVPSGTGGPCREGFSLSISAAEPAGRQR